MKACALTAVAADNRKFGTKIPHTLLSPNSLPCSARAIGMKLLTDM